MDQEPRLTKRQRKEQRRQERREEQQRETTARTRKKWLIWSIVLALLGGSAVLLVSAGPGSEAPLEPDDDPVLGAAGARVVIEEYSDFQCPACKSAIGPVQQVVESHPEDVRLVYNDFPLQSHANAQTAAEAGQCAYAQDAFWEYHDRLFDEQEAWADQTSPRDTFLTYAQDLALDVDAFRTCLEERQTKGAVDRDVSEGDRRRVTATPTFFVNGELLSGGRSVDEWETIVADALAALPEATTPVATNSTVNATGETTGGDATNDTPTNAAP